MEIGFSDIIVIVLTHLVLGWFTAYKVSTFLEKYYTIYPRGFYTYDIKSVTAIKYVANNEKKIVFLTFLLYPLAWAFMLGIVFGKMSYSHFIHDEKGKHLSYAQIREKKLIPWLF